MPKTIYICILIDEFLLNMVQIRLRLYIQLMKNSPLYLIVLFLPALLEIFWW